jgi:hypothetical protein
MTTITLTRSAVNRIEGQSTYRSDFTISAANGITTKLFVKQRYTDPSNNVVDDFVGVASLTDIEDYPADNPNEGEDFYRVNTISLASSDPTLLDEANTTILAELQLLSAQQDMLAGDTVDKVYTITGDQVAENDSP